MSYDDDLRMADDELRSHRLYRMREATRSCQQFDRDNPTHVAHVKWATRDALQNDASVIETVMEALRDNEVFADYDNNDVLQIVLDESDRFGQRYR